MKHRHLSCERSWIIIFSIAITIAFVILIINHTATTQMSFCSSAMGNPSASATLIQLHAVLHYATSRDTPQQSRAEIRVTFDVLRSIFGGKGCNFLVFGLGHDSLMWSAFNANGRTMFLEEDPDWVQAVLTTAPSLRVHKVSYKTHLYDAKNLMAHYMIEPSCLPPELHLRGNIKCRLILSELPDEVYNKEWDVIMIDGPKGYFPEAPGRMATIFTAAVMAKFRTRPGMTHIMLHDVNRRVEKVYADRFLCKKHLVKAVDRLWHFVIPSAPKEGPQTASSFFC